VADARNSSTVPGPIRLPAALVAVALVVGSVGGLAPPSRAQEGTDPGIGATDSPAPVVPDPRVSPSLAAVPVDSPAYRGAVAHYREAEQRLNQSRATYSEAEGALADLSTAEARLVGERNEASRKRRKADARAAQLRAGVQQFAVASYMAGGIGRPAPPDLDLEGADERARRRVLADMVSEQQFAELAANVDQVRRMDAVLDQVGADLEDVQRRTADTEATRDAAIGDGARAAADLRHASQEVADTRLEARVVGLDFTLVVLDAYVKAATTLAFEKPACGLRWTALAGIGRTESGHGTYGGAVVQPNGDLTRPIIGIPLDGGNDTAVIADSDGGALDGDPDFDRAVGPMQFIPTSWRTLGRDGNGDRVADPQNMYDAALAAAGLLCRGRALDTDAALRAAFLGYNNSQAYASLVLDRMHGYDLFVIPPVP
jgi:membrane-bound lytic murein transglycosylase B